MRRHHDEAGFTLLELMVVLAIVAAMTVLALGTVQSQLPAQRLNSATRDLMSAIQQAKARSVRSGRPTKICIFRQAAATFKNQYLVVQCNDGQVCNDPLTDIQVCADDANGVIDAEVGASPKPWNFPSAITLPVGAGTYSEIRGDYSTNDTLGVEILDFRDSANAATTLNFVEIAFTSSGTISQNLTTKDAGGVMFTRMRIRSTAQGNPFRDLRWTVGGGVRILR